MKIDNIYGYKVCYQEFGKTKLKLFYCTNRIDGIIDHLRWCENHIDKYFMKRKLNNPSWYVFEVKTRDEYEKLWKDCPFKDDFSSQLGE